MSYNIQCLTIFIVRMFSLRSNLNFSWCNLGPLFPSEMWAHIYYTIHMAGVQSFYFENLLTAEKAWALQQNPEHRISSYGLPGGPWVNTCPDEYWSLINIFRFESCFLQSICNGHVIWRVFIYLGEGLFPGIIDIIIIDFMCIFKMASIYPTN